MADRDHRPTTRRDLLKMSAVGGATAAATWAAPSILSMNAAGARSVCPTLVAPANYDSSIVRQYTPPPTPANTDLGNPSLASDTFTNFWLEGSFVAPVGGIRVNQIAPGSFNGSNDTPGARIPAGQAFCTFFIHGDAVSDPWSLSGALTFPLGFTIVGVSYQLAQLTGSSAYENPNVTYNTYHPMEPADTMTWSVAGGQHTFSWTMNFGVERDQIRVFVA